MFSSMKRGGGLCAVTAPSPDITDKNRSRVVEASRGGKKKNKELTHMYVHALRDTTPLSLFKFLIQRGPSRGSVALLEPTGVYYAGALRTIRANYTAAERGANFPSIPRQYPPRVKVKFKDVLLQLNSA